MLLRAEITQIARKLEMQRPSAEFRRRKELWAQERVGEQIVWEMWVIC